VDNLLDNKASTNPSPHVDNEMTSPDTANTPIKHDTLKSNGNGNHEETLKEVTSLTTGGLAELKDESERVGEDVVEDEDGEEEEEEDSDDEEEDDEEPSLKYERLIGAVPDLLKKDSASALAVSNKLLVIPSSIIISSN